MEELVQLDLSKVQQRTREQVEAACSILDARARELVALIDAGKGTPEHVIELGRVTAAAAAEHEVLSLMMAAGGESGQPQPPDTIGAGG